MSQQRKSATALCPVTSEKERVPRLLEVNTWVYARDAGDGSVRLSIHNEEAEARQEASADPAPFCDNVFPLDLVVDMHTHRVYTRADRTYARMQGVPIEHARRLGRFGRLSADALRTPEEEAEVHRLKEELTRAGIDPGWPILPRERPKKGRKAPTR